MLIAFSFLPGGRPIRNEAVSRADGQVLRPLGGLRLGEGGPSQCLSRTSGLAGEGADRATVGACVLGEELACLCEHDSIKVEKWTAVWGHTSANSFQRSVGSWTSVYCHITIPQLQVCDSRVKLDLYSCLKWQLTWYTVYLNSTMAAWQLKHAFGTWPWSKL